MFWFIVAILLLVAGVSAAFMLRAMNQRTEAEARRRKRYALGDSGERIPFIDPADRATRGPTLKDLLEEEHRVTQAALEQASAARLSQPPGTAHDSGSIGRVVHTPDGEAILTRPPFALKESVLSRRQGRYANALMRRLPPWIALCPRVRVDALVNPTSPAGRDAADWREWRRRARFRAVDFVFCDRRTWQPLLAVIIERPMTLTDMKTPGGGKDRIIDEILHAAGLPLVRCTGQLHTDWPMIAPYVDEAILRTRDQCVEGDGASSHAGTDSTIQSDATVELLRVDDEKGEASWLLQ